jgi:hypothetical protein
MNFYVNHWWHILSYMFDLSHMFDFQLPHRNSFSWFDGSRICSYSCGCSFVHLFAQNPLIREKRAHVTWSWGCTLALACGPGHRPAICSASANSWGAQEKVLVMLIETFWKDREKMPRIPGSAKHHGIVHSWLFWTTRGWMNYMGRQVFHLSWKTLISIMMF